MGLIRAAAGAAGSTMADQWKEFFYCEAMDKEVMVVKGTKRTSSRSSNKRGSDNIITSGSGIAVADGQCMMIVEQGKVVDICADPGEYTYDASTEPSIFAGSLGEGIRSTFQTIGKRFAYGGDTGKDQRVYYFNTKELVDNKFGTPTPIPFRVVDSRIGLDIDVSVRCHGVYSYRIADPLLFYTNVCGNVEQEYTREELDSQLKTEFVSALQPAFGRLSELELRPNQIVTHNTELENAMNEVLSAKWEQLRGLKVVSVALGSVTLPDEDAEMIKQAQRTAMMRDPSMAAATLTGAQADAMKAAASNSAGAMTGFMGMGMASNAGGLNAQQLFEMGQKQQAQAAAQNTQPQQKIQPAADGDSWTCSCGAVSTGKFCPECGAPRPADESWTCSCGTVNKGKFCMNCGTRKPEKKMRYRCSKCGWEPADPENPPKFCPECGDPFGTEDAV
ncbi:SPFH domain-containing protein [Blautia schinkii]|uniref:SPFH domain-containing protein n=1 Tax=Blautia schinkii TaxID=180164 RepID=UPI00156DE736|nr:SPFH domain-containing protein [Blautia schinkii]NSG81908.1 SPFH domain-containing protein [Blautia schinkii]NSK22509.1 SPFH domain-containing protein [Blautia schinkii]NSK25551.1 SPFH domain-containing protein [Blautia schinkii]NSK31696.1 SPFH domain-containing protein [Blautia schinkii]NSK50876.1 SPFH domain-containing protein [Blautia schinkii]